MKLSTKREMFSVGDPLPLTIGSPGIDSLCNFLLVVESGRFTICRRKEFIGLVSEDFTCMHII